MNADNIDESHRSEIFREQVRDLYSSVLLTTGLTLFGAAIMVYLSWSLVEPDKQFCVLLWLTLFTSLICVRLIIWCFYTRNENRLEKNDELLDPRIWARLEVGLMILYGVFFGGFFMLLYDTSHSLFFQMQVVTFIFCMVLASASFLSCYMPCYMAATFGSCGLVIIRLLAEADFLHFAMVPLVIIFNVVLFKYVVGLNRKFVESIQVRLQNLDLIQVLLEKKEVAEQELEKSKLVCLTQDQLQQSLQAIALCSSGLFDYVEDEEGRKMLGTIEESVAAVNDMLSSLSNHSSPRPENN